jgi:hypothetical protein
MSFAKKIVMGSLFLVLPVLLSACGDAGETEKRKKIGPEAEEKFKQFQEKQSGKK